MVDNPEQIAAALLSLITNATNSFGWATPPSRAAKIWAATAPANQPCLYLIGMGGSVIRTAGYGVSKLIYRYVALVYMRADESAGSIPETQLNGVWTAVVNALLPSMPGTKQDLGIPNIVNDAWIEGDWLMDTGILDAQQELTIPILVSTGAY